MDLVKQSSERDQHAWMNMDIAPNNILRLALQKQDTLSVVIQNTGEDLLKKEAIQP